MAFLVDLSQLYSNTFQKIVKYKSEHLTTSVNNTSEKPLRKVNSYGETEIQHIRQHQKILSDEEIKHIIEKYNAGVSTYELAQEYGCHRYTISNALKRSGIVVDKHVEGRKYKTEEVIRLYTEEMKSVKQIAEMFDVCDATIYKCLKRNRVYTKRTRWDYEK